MSVLIRKYEIEDANILLSLIENEGLDWQDYWLDNNKNKYLNALKNSIVFLAFEDNTLVGYIRSRSDDGYGIYIYDLLVDKKYRKKGYGKALIDAISKNYPEEEVYIMSDVDSYYEKQGYIKIGSIFTKGE